MLLGGGSDTLSFSNVPSFYGCAHRSPLKTGRLNGARRLVQARPLLLTFKGPKRGPAGVLGIPVGVCLRVCVCVCVCVCVRTGKYVFLQLWTHRADLATIF